VLKSFISKTIEVILDFFSLINPVGILIRMFEKGDKDE